MLNKVILAGRLCTDPELRRTQNGTAVATVSLAVDRDYAKPDEPREVDFVPLVAWSSTAEFMSRNFSKGRMAIVVGRLALRRYEDHEGKKKSVMEVIVSDAYFGDSKTQNNVSSPPDYLSDTQAKVKPADFAEMTFDNSDLPF